MNHRDKLTLAVFNQALWLIHFQTTTTMGGRQEFRAEQTLVTFKFKVNLVLYQSESATVS